jgi:ribosomal protein S18 acetylase RimI-like enzyme
MYPSHAYFEDRRGNNYFNRHKAAVLAPNHQIMLSTNPLILLLCMAFKSMNIRQAHLADLDALAPLFDGYRVFYGQDSDVPAARAFLEERMQNKESTIFLAESDGEAVLPVPVGFTQLYPIFSSVQMKRSLLLNDLYVHPDHRGKGYSKALLERSKELARHTNAAGLHLETQITNTIGNRLYPATGFELENESCNFYFWECV